MTGASTSRVTRLVRGSSGPQAIVDRVGAMNRKAKARDDLTVIAVRRTV